jgi:hypothetical protein
MGNGLRSGMQVIEPSFSKCAPTKEDIEAMLATPPAPIVPFEKLLGSYYGKSCCHELKTHKPGWKYVAPITISADGGTK